jgi:DNA-binding NarL/FixJ family response regulator
VSGTGLYGRNAELDAIAQAVDAVARGGRSLVVLRGEAGIGKTRLLMALREQAGAQGFVVLEGRASELEHDIPLVPVLDALAARLPDADVLAGLGPERLGLLAEVLPAIGVASSGGERWRLYRALGDLLALIAAGRPLLLVVDDLHWADGATQELLEHLVRRPPGDSLLVACGARPGPAAERLIAACAAGGAFGVTALNLAPLDRAAADALLEPVSGSADRDRCFEQSGGNPLLLVELARDGGRQAVPDGIVAALRLEVSSLPGDARVLVQAAAIAGDPFDLDLAAHIGGLDDRAALRALDVITQRQLARATGDPRRFAFRHPVVRTAVYAMLGAGERLAGHAAAARSLAPRGGSPTARAHHLAHAAVPGDGPAAVALQAAAAEVRARAPGVAADWLLAARRADFAAVEPALLAQTLAEAARLPEALAVANEAAAEPRLALTGASVERTLGRHDAAHRRLLAALEAAAPDSPAAARLRVDLAVGAYQRGDYAQTLRWAREAGGAEHAGSAMQAIAAVLLGVGEASAGDAGAAAASLDRALEALEVARDEELGSVAEPAMAISWGLLALDRLPEGLAASRRIAAAARHAGNGPAAVPHDLAAVLALGLLGRVGEAEPIADDAEQAARVSANAQLLQWTLWLRAWVLMECGQIDPAHQAATESAALAAELDDSASGVVARAVLGAILAAREEPARARQLLAAYDIDHGWICRWAPVLVECDLALNDLAGAREHAERAAALAPGTGMAGARAAAGRAQALVALAQDDAAAAAALATAAAGEAGLAGAALEEARCRLVAGRALLATDRDAALAELTAACEQAARCGAPRVADEARRELRRAGARVGRGGARATGEAGLAALSHREREVAGLVADGLTNREIGSRLYLSEKTIETHLTRVFQKLGLRSRTQVAAAVARAQ